MAAKWIMIDVLDDLPEDDDNFVPVSIFIKRIEEGLARMSESARNAARLHIICSDAKNQLELGYFAPGTLNRYLDSERVDRAVTAGGHREIIGSLWEEIGGLQRNFLVAQGLQPHHRLLDIGCGSLRCGVKLVPYLDPGHYYGIDARRSLLDAGYEREIIPAGLGERLPRTNLIVSEDFDSSSFGERFDFALAQSVFTHMPWNDIRLCLEKLAPVMAPQGVFFATFFELPDTAPAAETMKHSPGNTLTYPNRDPYHYRPSDLKYAARGLPWHMEWHAEWDHPRAQRMAKFTLAN